MLDFIYMGSAELDDGLTMICGFMSDRIMGYKLIKPLRDNPCQIDYGYMCIWTDCQTKSHFSSQIRFS